MPPSPCIKHLLRVNVDNILITFSLLTYIKKREKTQTNIHDKHKALTAMPYIQIDQASETCIHA